MIDCRITLVVQNSLAGNFSHNHDKTLDFIHRSKDQHANIVVFPEMNLTGYVSGKKILTIANRLTNELKEELSLLSNKLDITILTGMARRNSENKIFASHLVFAPKTKIQIYNKIHTAPPEKEYYSQGDKVIIFTSTHLNFGVQLCYDAHFPGLSSLMAQKGADIIFIPHASPRGTSTEKYQSWLRHLRARAFDNGIFIAACNQTGENNNGLEFPGLALVIGPDGNVLDKRIDSKEGILFVDLKESFLEDIRNHKMKYFLPNSRKNLY